jgi:hypothetical protein
MSDQDPELDLQHVQNWQSERLRNASAIISDAQTILSFSPISPTSTSTNGYRSHRSEQQSPDCDSAPKPTLLRTGRDIGIHRPPAVTKKKTSNKKSYPPSHLRADLLGPMPPVYNPDQLPSLPPSHDLQE